MKLLVVSFPLWIAAESYLLSLSPLYGELFWETWTNLWCPLFILLLHFISDLADNRDKLKSQEETKEVNFRFATQGPKGCFHLQKEKDKEGGKSRKEETSRSWSVSSSGSRKLRRALGFSV